jgi:uncharacterized protein (TIGR02597 family)
MNKFLAFPLFVSALVAGPFLHAQTVATDPVGAVSLTIKGNSDTIVAVPLTAMPSYSGAVATKAAAGGNAFNLTVSGTTGWTTDQFANLYYVRMTSGAKAGMYYTITANTASQVTLDTAGDDLSGIAAADTFKILKYWTLGTLFPPASAGTAANPLTASEGLGAPQRRSQIILPDNASAGINLSSTGTFFFINGGNWVAADTGNPVSDNTILYPDTYFTIRQPSTVPTDVAWTSVGSVALTKLIIPLGTRVAGQQDNHVGVTRPVDLKLSELGLESGFMDSVGLGSPQRRDTLLVFDNTTAAFNKSASKTFFHYAGNWYEANTGSPIANDQIIPAGSGLIVRKYQNVSATTSLWSNLATY